MTERLNELLAEVHVLREQAQSLYVTSRGEVDFVETSSESLARFLRADAANLRAVTELHLAIAARNDEIADLLGATAPDA